MTDGFREHGRRLSNWGRWGDDDALGTLNLITPERRAAAAQLVRTGVSVPLGLPFDKDGPQVVEGTRRNPIHLMTRLGDREPAPGGFVYLDDAVFLHTQCATQIDALSHVSYDGLLYNGHPVESVTRAGATVLGVETFRAGIQGRGVLFDLPAVVGRSRMEAGESIGLSLLEECEAAQDVRVGEGDILLLRTGWMSVFTIDGDRARYLGGEPGITLEVAGWLHNRGVAFLASDTWGIEVSPGERADEEMPLHCVLIRDMGLPLGEMFDLDALAAQCAATETWEFQFTCLPLPITGAVGSPIAPVATL
ncbi:MAG: cyclase family protein [Microbacteriaceae bacterium]